MAKLFLVFTQDSCHHSPSKAGILMPCLCPSHNSRQIEFLLLNKSLKFAVGKQDLFYFGLSFHSEDMQTSNLYCYGGDWEHLERSALSINTTYERTKMVKAKL